MGEDESAKKPQVYPRLDYSSPKSAIHLGLFRIAKIGEQLRGSALAAGRDLASLSQGAFRTPPDYLVALFLEAVFDKTFV